MPQRSAVDGVDDVTHELTAEIVRWLRYHPDWSGEVQLMAGIQKGAFTTSTLALRSVRGSRAKKPPEDCDRAATNSKALEKVRTRIRLQAERALSYHSTLYGTVSATCHFRHGVLVRSDVYVSDTELSSILKT